MRKMQRLPQPGAVPGAPVGLRPPSAPGTRVACFLPIYDTSFLGGRFPQMVVQGNSAPTHPFHARHRPTGPPEEAEGLILSFLS